LKNLFYGDITNLTKHHWLTNKRFFAEFIQSATIETYVNSIQILARDSSLRSE